MYETTQQIWLTVTDIKQYFYCKAIPYINHVLGIYEQQKEYQTQGKEAHQELSKLEKRRKTILKHIKTNKNTKKLFRINITSNKHKITGILDCLIKQENKYIPIEYKQAKTQKGKPHPHHKYQLVAYAIILDDIYNTITTKGYIYYHLDDKLIKININETMKKPRNKSHKPHKRNDNNRKRTTSKTTNTKMHSMWLPKTLPMDPPLTRHYT